MESILDWIRREGVIFRGGSGSGVNLSRLRSSKEQLSKGGYASGPVSFMRGADASAGTIKSGGKTRRAAKMVVLDVDHPDIEEFIWCKAKEERKARVLEAAGYDMSLDSPDWASIQYQNANNSVRVTDAFMQAAEDAAEWNLNARTDGTVVDTVDARGLLREMADAAWQCADPGVQYDTTINAWHTCPNSGRINASNPCSEYMHLDDSACNLASLNLMKFRRDDGELDVEAFEHAVDVVFLAQEILVGYSSYPTTEIERNARAYRELGLGYANLGALLMARSLPYDSDDGRAYAAAVTALMTGRAYRKSAEIASRMGPYAGYQPNAAAMLGVIAKHRAAVGNIENTDSVPDDLLSAARKAWDDALDAGEVNGFRNSQATVLAPTGTISFMMDCDTTGVEPDFSLVKSKKLVGGGEITIVNKTVPMALEKLGYAPEQVEEVVAFIDERNTVVGAPSVKPEHYPIFDCAIGDRAIHYSGHVKMMGAVQPFISGAISKTVNMPETVTVEEVRDLFVDAWKLGVKAIAIYRDNCKVAQPLSSGDKASAAALVPGVTLAPQRRQAARGPHRGRPEVPRRRVRGLHPRRPVRRRDARRHLRGHREGGHDPRRPHELVHDLRLARPPVRRAARGLRLEVLAHALRAGGADERPGHPHREVDRRLHLPLDGQEVPHGRPAGGDRHPLDRGARPDGGALLRRRGQAGERGERVGAARGAPARPDGPLQHARRRRRVRPLRRPHGANGLLLHVQGLRHQHRLLVTGYAHSSNPCLKIARRGSSTRGCAARASRACPYCVRSGVTSCPTRPALRAGFPFPRSRVPFLSQQGSFALPYSEGRLLYPSRRPFDSSRTTTRDGRWLRLRTIARVRSTNPTTDALRAHTNCVCPSSTSWHAPGQYRAFYPCFVDRGRPRRQDTFGSLGSNARPARRAAACSSDDLIERRYANRRCGCGCTKVAFEASSFPAYREQCAICRLKETRLLDAAHIVGDLEERGEPVVSNGLSLCSIHHRAFDHDLIGVSPDFRVHVSRKLLDDDDGPMLEVLKTAEGTVIEILEVPR